MKAVSQCFHPADVSFVTMYCGYKQSIDIVQAAHGRRLYVSDDALATYCHPLPTDCITDVSGHYNWSACSGRRHCVHSLRHVNESRQCADNHRLTYLQVSHKHVVVVVVSSVEPIVPNVRRKSFDQCSIRFFPSLLENSFNNLPVENILHSHRFLSETDLQTQYG